ncbi:EamA family transporter [Thermodesulfobacteriota bacterium]
MTSKTSILLLVTLLCWGITPIIEKIGLKSASPLAGATVRSIAITTGLLLITFFTNRTKELFSLGARDVITFSLSGLLAGLVAMLAYFHLLQQNETSRIVPVTASYPLVTALLSYLVLSESITPQKAIGTVLIVSGIYLVKL